MNLPVLISGVMTSVALPWKTLIDFDVCNLYLFKGNVFTDSNKMQRRDDVRECFLCGFKLRCPFV